jgi:hypothetical protein
MSNARRFYSSSGECCHSMGLIALHPTLYVSTLSNTNNFTCQQESTGAQWVKWVFITSKQVNSMGWFATLIAVSAICPGHIPGNPAYKIASELEASLSVAFNVFSHPPFPRCIFVYVRVTSFSGVYPTLSTWVVVLRICFRVVRGYSVYACCAGQVWGPLGSNLVSK